MLYNYVDTSLDDNLVSVVCTSLLIQQLLNVEQLFALL